MLDRDHIELLARETAREVAEEVMQKAEERIARLRRMAAGR